LCFWITPIDIRQSIIFQKTSNSVKYFLEVSNKMTVPMWNTAVKTIELVHWFRFLSPTFVFYLKMCFPQNEFSFILGTEWLVALFLCTFLFMALLHLFSEVQLTN
jgi:hypothetical protein